MRQDTSGNPIITPKQRMDAVPVDCASNSEAFGWSGIRVEDYPNLPESDIYCAGMDHHLLVFHYKAMEGIFYHECAGRKTQTVLHSGQLSFIPAGADNRWVFGRGEPSALHILLHKGLFELIAKNECAQTSKNELKDAFQVTSPELLAISQLFHLELIKGGGSGPLYADTLATALCHMIIGHFGGGRARRGTIVLPNVSKAQDLIHADFTRPISLQELADVCGLSRSQLVRNFKRCYGMPPHQYLILQRINHAKLLLRKNHTQPLSQIASSLGFSDQSHFNRHFHAVTGQTPTQFHKLRHKN